MQAYALTSAWFLWRRHRWGFSFVLLWVLLLAAVHLAVPPGTLQFAGAGLAVLTYWLILFYAIAVFSFAPDADVASQKSGFPRRMFTLPVPTRTLVVWPMLYATLMAMALWIVLAQC